MSESLVYKILAIDESEVGKTSILRRYIENKFMTSHLATIGVDFRTKALNICGKNVKLKIWDTAGQERYHNITNQMYKGADGIILVYSVIDESSFQKITELLEQITSNITDDEISIILLGNKCDLEGRAITKEQGKEKADSLNIKYYETSALDGRGINEAFEELAKEIMTKKAIINHKSKSFSLHSDDKQKKDKDKNKDKEKIKKKKCC